MKGFDSLVSSGFNELHIKHCSATGLKAVVAIDSTKRGPALGGCRFIHYSSFDEAIIDAIALARGMTYKAAGANLPLGGGKMVVLKPTGPFDRQAYFAKLGEFVHQLGGRYITAIDSGTALEDMTVMARHTPFVASLANQEGNPVPWTARGVVTGLRAAVAQCLHRTSLKGLTCAIQGLGNVGLEIAKILSLEGVNLMGSDIHPEHEERAKQEVPLTLVPVNAIHQTTCDILMPCALGGTLNANTVPEIKAKIVVGCANNQLATPLQAKQLMTRGIVYVPDYLVNSGGLILAAAKYLNTLLGEAEKNLQGIYQTVYTLLEQAAQLQQDTHQMAEILVKDRI